MCGSLCANIYKMAKNPIFWLMFFWPVVFAGVFIAYYRVASWSVEQELSTYFQVLSLGSLCLITAVCTYVVQQEQRAGLFFNVLCIGRSRVVTLFSFFVMLSSGVGIGVILAAFIFFTFWGEMSAAGYVFATILILIPIGCLMMIQLFMAFRFGSTWSIGSGAVFLLIGTLSATGLFDSWWYCVPPAWGLRFSDLMIYGFFYPEYTPEIARQLRLGISICFVMTIIAVFGVSIWFSKWDGGTDRADEVS